MTPINVDSVILIHNYLVEYFNKADDPISPPGIKHIDMLESSVARPYQTAGGQEVFDTPYLKASALFHAIINNHPFHNGNKRTALVSTCVLLDQYSIWIDRCDDDDFFEFTRKVAAHEISDIRDNEISDIAEWFEYNSRRRTKGEKPLKYYELKSILNRLGYIIDSPDKQFLDIYKDGVKVDRIIKQGIHGLRPYHTDYIAGLRKKLQLTTDFGIDSETFYGRIGISDQISEIIEMRGEVIRRLART